MVATDGHRLAWAKVFSPSGAAPFDRQLLPRKVLNQLRRLTAEEGTNLFVARGENHIAFRLGDRVLLSEFLNHAFLSTRRFLSATTHFASE